METCKICNQEFKNLKGLSTHLNNKHSLNTKEYYDKFLIKDGEGKCTICGGETTYRNMGVGYLVNCSTECRDKNKNIKHDYWLGKNQPKEMVIKRVLNTNKEIKQKNWENSLLTKYGVSNPAKLDNVKEKIGDKHKGLKKPRTKDWQKRIVESKRKNNTLKHNEETKNKISKSLNKYYSENLDREKYVTTSNNINHFCGWYNGLYFRSSLELSFLVNNEDTIFTSCEKNKFKIIYQKGDKQKSYYPDFTDNVFIYEIKPSGLLNYKDNQIKIIKGIEKYGDTFKVVTEKDSPYIQKSKIFELIDNGSIILNQKSIDKLKNYKY